MIIKVKRYGVNKNGLKYHHVIFVGEKKGLINVESDKSEWIETAFNFKIQLLTLS